MNVKAIADALRAWSGPYHSNDPLHIQHNEYCTAHNEGRWCCLDEGHELFADLCAHIANWQQAPPATT
jgi:hypothetical protein